LGADEVEPLYVDLRPTGGLIARWLRFRAESLRVIAALFGVDYSALRREDERRRRRRRIIVALAVLTTSFGLGSGYLISSVPADHWAPVPLPGDYGGAPLLPVTELAVYRPEPSTLLFRARGAEHAAQHPERPIGILSGGGDERFLEQARDYLDAVPDLDAAQVPLATLQFQVFEATDLRGAGEMRIYGLLDAGTGEIGFARSLLYQGRDWRGKETRLLFPPTVIPGRTAPLEFEPWPADPLIAGDLLPFEGEVRGRLQTGWSAEATTLQYEIVDNAGLFLEGSDGLWFEQVLVSNRSEGWLEIAGEKHPADHPDAELWEVVLADPQWVHYEPPETKTREGAFFRSSAEDPNVPGPNPRRTPLAPGLWKAITASLPADFELDLSVRLVSRSAPEGAVAFATVVSRLWNDIAMRGEHHDTRHFLRLGEDGDWRETPVPTRSSEIAPVDVHTMGADGGRILLLTDREGYYLTEDAGLNWRPFNLGETSLLSGSRVHTLVAGNPVTIYALVVGAEEGVSDSALFRHGIRGHTERLRLGAIRLLGGQDQ
jgi:hypothetical protein